MRGAVIATGFNAIQCAKPGVQRTTYPPSGVRSFSRISVTFLGTLHHSLAFFIRKSSFWITDRFGRGVTQRPNGRQAG
jgi:hypothetical protein